jgi:glycosyltransferase involved in cell wall biosynthesis
MPREPKVSIGMPVYNAEDLIAETLDSILGQTLGDFEVVISDNASADGTEDICREYVKQDARIRYERNATNLGIVANFNRTFHLSRARYFKWQAHDDVLAPEYLERCVTVLDEDPTTVVVGTRVAPIDADGSRVPFDLTKGAFVTAYGEHIPRPRATDGLVSPRRLTRFAGVLFDVTGPVHSEFVFGLFRSDALRRTPLIEDYIGAEKVLLARLSLMGHFREVPVELFFRRYHPGHVGGSSQGTWKGRIRLATARTHPSERRMILFPLARQVRGYFEAIASADITRMEKMRCAAIVVHKLASVGWKRGAGMAVRARSMANRRHMY